MANFFIERREQLKLSQHDIGVAMGMTGGAVGMWERGENAPSIKLSAKLAEVYRVSEARIIRAIVELSKSITEAKSAAMTK